MNELSKKQRRYLDKQAHHLDPVVWLGKQGLSAPVIKSVSEALGHHELIKVKFGEHKDERRELSEKMAGETGAQIVRIIGNITILYKQQPEAEKRKITLPEE